MVKSRNVHVAYLCFPSALHALEDSVDCRLALASLVLEDGKEDEAISLLSPPEDLGITSSIRVIHCISQDMLT